MRFVDTQTVEGDVVFLKWQPVANGAAAEKAQSGENRCRGLRPIATSPRW